MKTKMLFSVLLLLATVVLNAQLKVKPVGKVIIGGDRGDDPNNLLTMQLLGPSQDLFRYGAKLAFGDFGRYESYSWNTFIGEYGNYDSDRLWLHGKNGIYLTYGRGDDIVGYWDVNQPDRFTFNCDVYTGTIKLTSDSRLKTNVNKISNSMSQLRKLNGVSYNLLKKEDVITKSSLKSAKMDDTAQPSNKELKDKGYFEALTAKLQAKKPKRMGFVAQDLQKVFPDLVDKDSAGYFSVDYIGLIPVIVEALKEQDIIISDQKLQLEALKALVNSTSKPQKASAEQPTETDVLSYPVLEQNVPNPFTADTKIGYYLPATTGKATLYVYDMNGVQLKTYPITQRGKGNIIINGSALPAGMYLYALIADGNVVDTKRMILTK